MSLTRSFKRLAQRTITQPVSPLPRWLAAMRVNLDPARCRPSLGVNVLVAEGGKRTQA
jgi:hypothetical protein